MPPEVYHGSGCDGYPAFQGLASIAAEGWLEVAFCDLLMVQTAVLFVRVEDHLERSNMGNLKVIFLFCAH